MTTNLSSPECKPPGWLLPAISLLAWSVKRAPLSESTITRLSAEAQPFRPSLKEKKIDSLLYLSCGLKAPDQLLYDRIWSVQREALLSIAGCMVDENVEFYIFKGSECSERWYQSRALGIFNDVDILAPLHEMGRVKAILYQNGFRQAQFDAAQSRLVDRDVTAVGAVEAQHYELAPFIKLIPLGKDADYVCDTNQIAYPMVCIDGLCMVAVEVDVHHGVATDIEIDDVTLDARPSAFNVGLTFSDSNQLWILTSRYYTEVALFDKRSLRDFCYVLPIIAAGDVDWDLILRVAAKYELHASLFYYLSFMSHLAGDLVPPQVLAQLSPLKGARLRDAGWQLGKLFDLIEAFPFDLNSSECVAAGS